MTRQPFAVGSLEKFVLLLGITRAITPVARRLHLAEPIWAALAEVERAEAAGRLNAGAVRAAREHYV